MKIRKITAYIAAIVLSAALFCGFIPTNKVSAFVNGLFVYGYSYSNSYVTDKIAKDNDFTFETDKEYYFTYKTKDAEDKEENWSAEAKAKSGNTTFLSENIYVVKFYSYTGEGDAKQKVYLNGGSAYSFATVKTPSEDSIYYADMTSENIGKYNDSIKTKLSGKKLGDSFYYPDIDTMLRSLYFAYSDLTKTVYYAAPKSTSFSSTTSSSFNLSALGTYSFYVVAKDYKATALTVDTDKLERRADGWYDGDVLTVPIFTFRFGTDTGADADNDVVKGPEITVGTSENGYIGLKYEVESITVVADDESTEYRLFYSATNLKDTYTGDSWTSSNTVEKFFGEDSKATDITDNKDVDFDSSALTFTPDKKGYYYVVCKVVDGRNLWDTVVTNPISVQSEYAAVKYESQFFKYNYVSIIFLSIAVLSLAGIIVLLFVKPKEKVEEDAEVTEKTKK